ncbi:MAG TPA: hypothetical protein VFX59_03705 [Polyangiales bacterium]|nr:hypothetical protein [Polyangiales bacterium]
MRKLALLLTVFGVSCGDDDGGPGSLRVDLVAEETITDGIPVEGEAHDHADGEGHEHGTLDYAVSYSKYLVSVGQVQVANTRSGDSRELPGTYVADLRTVGTTGVTLGSFDDIASGQWDQFGYRTPIASAGFTKVGAVSDADAQAMVDQQLTYWIEGEVAAAKPVKFVIKVPLPVQFASCENDGEPGVAVTEGRPTTAQLTLHGDHMWFTTLVRGDESTVVLRAGWLVKADKDGDGLVTSDDLKTVKAEEVFPTSEGYNLSGGLFPVTNAYDFVRAQLASQGHLNGEGECVATAL